MMTKPHAKSVFAVLFILLLGLTALVGIQPGGSESISSYEKQAVSAAYFYWQHTSITTVAFTAFGPDSANYTWSFGDDTDGYGKTVTHTFQQPGSYMVRLTTDQDGDSSSNTRTLTISSEPPIVDFTWEPETPTTQTEVHFWDASIYPENESKTGPWNWTWDLDDGHIKYGPSINHTFIDNGIYEVMLTLRHENGTYAPDSATKQVFVFNVPPVAQFYWTRENGGIHFDATNSRDTDGTIVNYSWSFDDGNTSYLQNPTHIYDENGSYDVMLTIVDNDGETDTLMRTVDTTNYLPDVQPFIHPAEATIKTDVVFNDSSVDMDGTIVNRTWDFGDGVISHERNTTHRYGTKGSYTVTLTVIDNEYAYNTTTREVDIVNLPPDVYISWDPVYPAVDENVTFYNYSIGPGDIWHNTTDPDGTIVNQTWLIDNQTAGYGPSVTHMFSTNGLHTVTLIVRDDSDDTNRSTRQVHVADIYVDDDQSPDWYDHSHVRTIQEGVDNASAGNLIHVLEGTYPEEVVVNKPVTLVGKDATVDGIGGTAFTVTAATTVLHEIHIINTSQAAVVIADSVTITDCQLDTLAGGIHIQGDHALVTSNTFQQGYGSGAAVRVEGSHAYIAYNAFMQTPDGIAIVDGVNHTIEDNSFTDAIHAVQIKNAEDCFIRRNIFRDNHVAVDIINQYCTIENNVLRDNDKAILLRALGSSVVNNTLMGNTVGIEITGDLNTITGTVINDSTEAAIILSSSSGTDITDCILSGNAVGIDALDSGQTMQATIRNVTFSGTKGDSIVMYNAAATISGCTFSSVTRGICINQSTAVTVQSSIFDTGGTAIYIQDAAPSIEGCDISGYPSGIVSHGQHATIMGSTLHNNTIGLQLAGDNTSLLDCFITDNDVGVAVLGARNLTVNCTIHNNNDGMTIQGGENISIEGARFANNTNALSLTDTHDVTVRACFIETSSTAIALVDTNDCQFAENHLHNNHLAVTLLTSPYNTFDGNNLTGNTVGFLLSKAPSNVLRDNSFTDNDYALDLEGSSISQYYQDIDTSNMVNGQPVHYITHQSDVEKGSQYGYLAFVSCDNVTVTGATTEPNGEGLLLVDVHNFSIQQGTFTRSRVGAVLFASSHGTIAATNCSDNTDDGISMTRGTHNVSITGCTITSNGQRGINLYRSTGGAGHVSISDSHVMDNWLGINIENTRANVIENLTLSGHQDVAIRLYKSDDASISNVTLHDNTGGLEIIRSTATLNKVDAHHHDTAIMVTDGTMVIRDGTLHDNNVGIAATQAMITVTEATLNTHMTGVMANNATLLIAATSFEDNERALHAVLSTVTVDGCTIANNMYGIQLHQANGGYLVNCTDDAFIANNTYGITVNNSIGVTVDNCSFFDNLNALTVTASTGTTVDDCLAFNNTDAFIVVDANDTAISNSLLHHNVHALDIQASNTTVMYCSFWKNMYGIRLLDGRFNSIYHNNFAYNMQQASDVSVNNSWDNGYPAGGNYWSDYAGTDHRMGVAQNQSGSDDIGDIPYPVPGGSTMDTYPLLELVDGAAVIPNSPPDAAFFIYPSHPLSTEAVDFVDQSTDPNGNSDIVTWQWDFGDGNTSSLQHPSHTYLHPGNYTVNLTVTDSQGVNNSYQKNVTVINTPPEAHFTLSPQQTAVGETVLFTDDSTDSNGDIASWNWMFGDGSTSSQQNPTHQYDDAGTYTVTLTVTDADGATDTYTATATVSGIAPTAAFSAAPSQPKTGDPVAFTDLSTDDGDVVTWHWDFGDGNASAAQNPSHEYEEAGTYTVTLTIWDDDGTKDTTTKTITVEEDNNTPGFMLPLLLLALAAVAIGLSRRRRGKI